MGRVGWRAERGWKGSDGYGGHWLRRGPSTAAGAMKPRLPTLRMTGIGEGADAGEVGAYFSWLRRETWGIEGVGWVGGRLRLEKQIPFGMPKGEGLGLMRHV